MVTVPGFLLKRLYVKGSLKTTANGFEFCVRNQLGSGYATEMLPVTLDGLSFPLDQTYFKLPSIPPVGRRSCPKILRATGHPQVGMWLTMTAQPTASITGT